METTRYQIVKYWAGHSDLGGSNKNWAACLIHVVAQEGEVLGEEDAPLWSYLAIYGKSGSNYVGGKQNPELRTRKAAEADFDAAVKQKMGASKGYVEIAGPQAGPQRFFEFLPFFKIPLLMPIPSTNDVESEPTAQLPQSVQSQQRLAYTPCRVKMLSLEDLEVCIRDDTHYGLSEKVNGVRCLVAFDGEILTAYNRDGERLAAVPQAAEFLKSLGCAFVVDGEQLTGKDAGHYAIFDLVAWNNEDIKTWTYQQRNRTLEEAMKAVGLIKSGGTTLSEALENSLVQGLALLSVTKSSQEARRLFAEIEQQKREGVVVRLLTSSYGGMRSVQKYKFYPTLDAIAIGIRHKGKLGSVKLGVIRETDGAVIEIGHVRSGLINKDVVDIQEEIKNGAYPVFEVAFLLDSTVKISLVQPSTSPRMRRADKRPQDCTTQQLIELLGEDRAPLIERAKAVPDLRFS